MFSTGVSNKKLRRPRPLRCDCRSGRFLYLCRSRRLSTKSLGKVLAVLAAEAVVLKAVAAHRDGNRATSLGGVAAEDAGKVHASRRHVVDKDSCNMD